MEKETSLLTFPCQFPIKIMGLANAEFESTALAIVRTHAPDLAESAIKSKLSKDSKYMALTVTVNAVNQEQLDAIYRGLTSCPLVLMAL